MPMPTQRPTLVNESTTATTTTTTATTAAATNNTSTLTSEDEYTARLSSFEICFQAQELVQDLVQKSAEFAQILRNTLRPLVIGEHHSYLINKSKIDETLKSFETILARLRFVCSVIHERKNALPQQQQQQQIDDEFKQLLQKERDELVEQVRLKNNYVKFAEEKIADIIWQINAIQTLRH